MPPGWRRVGPIRDQPRIQGRPLNAWKRTSHLLSDPPKITSLLFTVSLSRAHISQWWRAHTGPGLPHVSAPALWLSNPTTLTSKAPSLVGHANGARSLRCVPVSSIQCATVTHRTRTGPALSTVSMKWTSASEDGHLTSTISTSETFSPRKLPQCSSSLSWLTI